MTPEQFRREDFPDFLRLATEEQWVAEPWEFEFLLAAFPRGCLCLRDEGGTAVAFVTALIHGRSGWIGNLIVDGRYRGRGHGEKLFAAAMNALRHAGAVTFWLTASAMGKSLYEKHGFTAIDTIVRWSGVGRRRHAGHQTAGASRNGWPAMCSIDSSIWGDTRLDLLRTTAERGTLFQNESGFVVLQPCGGDIQIGPFSALDTDSAGKLFTMALRTVANGTRVYVDMPASNRPALRMFNRSGLRITGTNALMYAGTKPDYRPEMLYGLATMGSCG